ncbi:nucleoid-associated protein [Pseudomonas sp. S12(2018)]|uniref:nucleoid-associated protein n=1 Tax=Pseudomonas sp. S12(2018) TaxID=2219664 RepID=UPI0020CC0A26|nr:nucleoid-associated protein [Pseudomonas sp. S12(2018)]MCQ0166041.1 nucleoid-associated protein [Pseudomonas sp. S12(2018)]
MPFVLKHAVIHSYEKDAHTGVVGNVVRKPLFNVQLAPVVSLVLGIHTILGKAGNNVVWGQFATDGRQGMFPGATAALDANLDSADIFSALATTVIDELVVQSQEEALSTGGHILVSSYLSDNTPFILVTSIKQKGGIRLDENYVPQEVVEVDMDKIHQAARINLSRYRAVGEVPNGNDDAEDQDRTYLCFISRGRNSEASGYFIKALGCKKGIASARATKNAIDSVFQFFRRNENIAPFKIQARENVTRYLNDRLEQGQHAKLDAICFAALQALPIEQAELAGNLDNLKDYLNGEEVRVPDEFTVNKKALNDRVRIKGEADHWTLNFEKGALGEDANAEVYYNRNEGTLTLSNPSGKLLREIEREFTDRRLQ